MVCQLNEKAIFDVARKIESAEARSAYLNQVCSGDQQLLQRVMALAQIHDEQNSFLESPAVNTALTHDLPPTEKLGTYIDRYKLVHEIGHGGMGMVYMAVQKEPVKRKVALKVIKPGMDTKEVVTRFEAERQALALMDHPCIATVFDGGSTESGRPYFVMELVEGTRIGEYCDACRYTTRQRLELFIRVCHAIQHAHQRGVIHRDIKPSNILVTNDDDEAVPKVIDFGIAKALHQPLTDRSVHTQVAQMVGTPLYMSPEQAQRTMHDVDTRTDVYSLGVLLYELLTGTTPFDKERFKESSLDEVKRIIREEEPPTPSTRLSTLGAAFDTVVEKHHTDRRVLRRELTGELDWIVMRALEKDRNRRYESVSDFAKDVQRYLDDEAVEACPPSTAYRLKKFVRKHRTAMIFTGTLAISLFVGVFVSADQAVRATKAERIAKKQEQLAEKQMELAKEAAERERKLRAELEVLRTRAEAELAWDNLGFAERLRRDAQRFDEAESYHRKAVATLEKVVGRLPKEPGYQYKLALCLGSLADYLRSTDRTEEAEKALRKSVALYERVANGFPDQPFSVRPRLGAIRSLAQVLRDLTQYGEARKWLQEEEKIIRTRVSRGSSYDKLASEFRKSRIREIRACFLKPLPNSVTWLRELADLYAEDGQEDKAVAEYTKAIEADPDNSDLYQIRGDTYKAMGETKKAEADYEEAKRLTEEKNAR